MFGFNTLSISIRATYANCSTEIVSSSNAHILSEETKSVCWMKTAARYTAVRSDTHRTAETSRASRLPERPITVFSRIQPIIDNPSHEPNSSWLFVT